MAKGKKQENPNKVAQRKAERVAFVQSNPNLAPEVARQRFYVQTRAAELEAAGKDVDRAALRQKFQTGGVTREGFYTPGDVNRFKDSSNGNSLADSKAAVTPSVVPSTPSTPVAPTTTPTKITGGGKTPSSSYQAPQTTTSLGQVVQPSTSYMDKQPGTPVRGGEPDRGVNPPAIVRPQGTPVPGGEPRFGIVWKDGPPVIGDITRPGQMYAAEKNDLREFKAATARVSPQAPANPKALRQQAQADFNRVEGPKIKAEMLKSNPLRAAQQSKIDAGYVAAPYDWTNMYKFGSGALVLGAEILGSRGGPVGAGLAAGITFNATERLGNLLEQKGAFGGMPGDPNRYEGKTDFKSAAVIAGSALAGDIVGKGIQKAVPVIASKIPGIKSALGKVKSSADEWATATSARETMNPAQIAAQKTQRVAAKGTASKTAMSLPKDTPYSGTNYRVVTGTSSMPSAESETAQSLMQRMRQEPLAIGPIDDPGATRPLYGPPSPVKAKPAAAPFPESETLKSGLLIPGTPKRNPVLQGALEDAGVVSKPLPPESLDQTKKNIEAAMQEDGVKTYDQMTTQEKKNFTRAQNKLKKSQEIELKGPDTVGSAKPDPVPNVAPKPASTEIKPLSSVEGNPRADQMRGHPSMGTPPEPPKLSVVTDEPAASPAPARRPPRKRVNETDADYSNRISAWQAENSDGVFKAPAGFEQTRGSISYQEKSMSRIESGLSRTNRSRTTAFIEDAGMSPEGYPMQMPDEHWMDFNKRSAAWSKSKGIEEPKQADNSYLSEGSLDDVKAKKKKADTTPTADGTPPKPSGLGPQAAYDPETGTWRDRTLNKKTGEYQWKGTTKKYASEEERIAGKKEYEAKRNADRKAKRAEQAAAKQEKQIAIAQSGGDAELGPFMFGGEPVGRSKVTLTAAEIPKDLDAQAYVELKTKPLSEVESAWLGRTPTEEEAAFFRELGNAKKSNAGRRVVRSKRETTPDDIKEYVRRFKNIRGERAEGQLQPGATPVALTGRQAELEKEIEQVLGTEAMQALKNLAIRGNTPPLTQNIPTGRGLESLAEVKAASGEPLLNKVVARQATPTSSGRLREQAATFFNAEGRLRGVSGGDRIRTWNRLTQSDWFRQLQEREPAFADFLRESNSDIAGKFAPMLAGQVDTLPKPKLRSMGWIGDKKIGAKEMKAAEVEFDRAVEDIGLGAYDLKGEELATGVKEGKFNEGTTLAQRSEAAKIEAGLERRTRLLRQIEAEDQQAFGDIQAYNRGFERGQSLDPMVDKGVTSDYGITDEQGFASINYAQFNLGRRQLGQDIQLPRDSRYLEANDAFVAKQKEIMDQFPGKANKEKRNELLAELAVNPEPNTLPSNPFAQEFGTDLPQGYVREPLESSGKVWDPTPWTDELDNTYDGSWITREEAAVKLQKKVDKEAAKEIKVEQDWQKRHWAFDEGRPWMEAAKERAIQAKKTQPVRSKAFDKSGFARTEADAAAEARRIEALDRSAAKIKAAKPKGKTAQEVAYELKNPVFGPPKPWNYDAIQEINQQGILRNWSKESMLDEESRVARDIVSEMFEDYNYDMGDFFDGIGRE